MKALKAILSAVLSVLCLVSFCACSQSYESDADADSLMPESTKNETSAPDTTAKTSEKLPDFTVYDMNGEAVTLYESFGKPLVVNFWATWCPPCKAEMPAFDALYKKYKDGVDFMMINVTDGKRDTVEAVKTFISDNGYSFPVYCDSDMDASYTYGVQSIPMSLFFNSEGKLITYQVGALSEEQLESTIKQMTEDIK